MKCFRLQIAVTMIDGTALTEGVTYSEGKPGDADTGIVSKPCANLPVVLICEEPANHCPTIDSDSNLLF